MNSSRLTNTLLALACLLLILNLLAPLFRAQNAMAVGEEKYESPAVAAAKAGVPALDNAANQINGGLKEIAQSNDRIADSIRQLAASNEHISGSLKDVANAVTPR